MKMIEVYHTSSTSKIIKNLVTTLGTQYILEKKKKRSLPISFIFLS